MRVAIQISGEMRTLSFAYTNLKKYILDSLGETNIDIFLHTWRKDADEESSGHGDAIALFRPRSYFVESYEDSKFLHHLPRSLTMFYSIYRVNECRKEYEKLLETSYDIVIRYRTDCIFSESPIPLLRKYLNERKPFLMIPKSSMSANPDGIDGDSMICDWLAFGTPDQMDIYCSTYTTWLEAGIYPVPESMLYLHLKMNRVIEQTTLRRPLFGFSLLNRDGTVRGTSSECGKQESKKS
jgi:hypothetical protein